MDFKIHRFPAGIKTRVITLSILIIMSVIGGMAIYFIRLEAALLGGELKKRATALVENFSRNCDYPLLLEDRSAIAKLAAAMMRDEDVTMIRVDKADHAPLFLQSKRQTNGAALMTVAADKTDAISMLDGVETLLVARDVWPPSEQDLVTGLAAVESRKHPLGRVTVGFSLQKTNALFLQSVVTSVVIVVVIAIVSILILMFLLGRFFAPLLVIAQGIRELSKGRLSHRLPIRRTDEIGELAGAFNEMAEALEGGRKRLEEYHQALEETVRIRTEALRDSETRYRAFFESTGTAMVIIDEEGIISLVNAEFERKFGYSRAEVERTKGWTTLFAPGGSERAGEYKAPHPTHPQQEPGQYEFRILTKGGQSRDVFITLSAIPGTMRTIASLIDISERKRLEGEFRQVQKMEAIGTLAGGIAHDFNNLLMGIQGYASLMMLDMESHHPHHGQLKNIEEYVQSGANLTRQLLAFARGGKYEIKPTNLNEIMEKTATLFGRTKKEIRIETLFEPALWSVDVDRGQMEQVLLNLYVNAWHAMPGGGDLRLETANIRRKGEGGEAADADFDHVRISVKDSGVGMDEKTKSRIFEPFFTTKEMGRGTGLGLATVYGIVQGHGGIITVESEKGKGTAFHICLPASHRVVSEVAPSQEALERGKETILMVDDEAGIVSVSKALMAHLGYRVLVATSGREALEIYRKEGRAIDLVILDMIMPGMGGGETFDHLKEMNPEIRVILSSGYSLDGMASRIMKQGCRSFIQKPFNLSSLSQKIREALQP